MSKPVILCVDDEIVILDSLQIELQQAFDDHYEYEMAESAEEALELIKELDADEVPIIVIVSDWLMPGMKGDEFLLQVHEKFPRIVKIMLTGQADQEAVDRVYRETQCQCLYKPIDSDTLIQTVKTCLENG